MLFLVASVFDEGVYAENFRVVEAPSRLAVAQHIVDQPDIWTTFLRNAHLYDPIVRGNMPYYADARPVTAEEALRLIDHSRVDGDSRAGMSILPITNVISLSASDPLTKLATTA